MSAERPCGKRRISVPATPKESVTAEIQRLREELALRDDSLANRRVRELRAKIERWQAALQEIADDPDGFYGSAASIAREALDG